MSISDNVKRVRERIARAAERAGRAPADVTLVAAAKSTDAAGIREALAAGVLHFGENRVQDAEEKLALLSDVRRQMTWHMIGHLQTNKAKRALELFDIVESVDSQHLGEFLDHRATGMVPVYLEVNVGGEASKTGLTPRETPAVCHALLHAPHLDVRGLMTVAPVATNPDDVRLVFRKLREMAAALGLKELSMGMTDDFEIAIEEGATSVRIGRALFQV